MQARHMTVHKSVPSEKNGPRVCFVAICGTPRTAQSLARIHIAYGVLSLSAVLPDEGRTIPTDARLR